MARLSGRSSVPSLELPLCRTNKATNSSANESNLWLELCKSLYPTQYQYQSTLSTTPGVPVPWKRLTLYNYFLEGVYETKRFESGPIQSLRLALTRGGYTLQIVPPTGEQVTQEGTHFLRLLSESEKRVVVVLIDKVQAQSATPQILEVEVLRLEADGHSTLRLYGCVLDEEKYESKRALNLAPISEGTLTSLPPGKRAELMRVRRYWSKAPAISVASTASPPEMVPSFGGAHKPPHTAILTAERRRLYELMISQLAVDGFVTQARELIELTQVPAPLQPPIPNLLQIFQASLRKPEYDRASTARFVAARRATDGLDFDLEGNEVRTTKQSPSYSTRFVTTHKNGVRCASFSNDGKMVATGSSDTSIKLLDVVKMETFNQAGRPDAAYKDDGAAGGSRPVIRTFYDHSQPVNDLTFHPNNTLLASCAKDASIRFFEFNSAARRAAKHITDSHNVRSIAFHPSGDYLLAGTDHFMIRIYDVNTLQPFVSTSVEEQHLSAVNQVRYAPDGKVYVSSGKDGALKVWDTVSNRCVRNLVNAHNAFAVNSACFSRNGRYILSGGQDSVVRLWDVASGKQLKAYVGAHQAKNRLQTCFTHNEDFILGSDEIGMQALLWDSLTGEIVQRLSGHTQLVRWIASSPVEPALITCSDDHRARFWTAESLNFALLSQ